MIAVLKIDNTFYEIQKEKIQEVSKDEILNKHYVNVPLIYLDTKKNNTKIVVYEEKETDKFIIENGNLHINSSAFFTLILNTNKKKVAFYLKKSEIVSLFRQFSFSNIIPFEMLILKTIIDNKNYLDSYIGFVSDELIVMLEPLNSIDKISTEETFIADNKEQIKSALAYQNRNKFIFDFITDNTLVESKDKTTNLINKKEFIVLIEGLIKEKSIKDKYSFYYQSKTIRIISQISAVLFIALSAYFYIYYIQKSMRINILTNQKAELNKQINKINNNKKQYKINYIYKLDNQFEFNEFTKILQNYLKDYNIKEYLIIVDKKKLTLKLDFTSLQEYLKFSKQFNKEIKQFRIYKNGNDIKVELVKKLDKRSSR